MQGKTGGYSFRNTADQEIERGCKKKLVLPGRYTLACWTPPPTLVIAEFSRANTVSLALYQMLGMHFIYSSQPQVGIPIIVAMLQKKGQAWRSTRPYSGSHNY